MTFAIDVSASLVLFAALGIGTVAFRAAPTSDRVRSVPPLPIVGHAPMNAVYAAVNPVSRTLATVGISANVVTFASLSLSIGAGVSFAAGHFGAGTFLGALAGFADLVDGAIARRTRTATRYGEVLDTLTDRYSDAALLGGIAVYVRENTALLVLTLTAWVGAFMVSFASSVLREHGSRDDGSRMRRGERIAWLLTGSALVPILDLASPDLSFLIRFAPLGIAIAVIAVVANVSAVRRLLTTTASHPRAAVKLLVKRPRLVTSRMSDEEPVEVGRVGL